MDIRDVVVRQVLFIQLVLLLRFLALYMSPGLRLALGRGVEGLDEAEIKFVHFGFAAEGVVGTFEELEGRDSKALVGRCEVVGVLFEGGKFGRKGDGRIHDDVEEGIGCAGVLWNLVREPETSWTDGFLFGFVIVCVEDKTKDYAVRGAVEMKSAGKIEWEREAYLTCVNDSSSRP